MTTTALPTSFLYVDCDIPEGMTLTEYRVSTRVPRTRLSRLAFRLGLSA